MNIAILIPAYKPNEKLVQLVQELSDTQQFKIIVVNDGSPSEYNYIFELIEDMNHTIVLQHSINMGKGAALKLGLDYINGQLPKYIGTITADADGQHSVQNILEIGQHLADNPDYLILGARDFKKDIPLRSKFGNILTNMVLNLFFGIKVGDTQTGLRGIPKNLIMPLLKIPYNRYEFEMEALLLCKRMGTEIMEVPIETIYIDNNADSHFNPLIDSIKIYFVLLRYMFASFITACIDYSIFIFVFPVTNNIMLSTYIGRLIALSVNYTLVRKYVFYSTENISRTFSKYILLVLVSGFISSIMVYHIVSFFEINIVFAKASAELLLYIANFAIQKEFIFGIDEK